jgi:hypothetical protein
VGHAIEYHFAGRIVKGAEQVSVRHGARKAATDMKDPYNVLFLCAGELGPLNYGRGFDEH